MEYLIIFIAVMLAANRLSQMTTGHSLGHNIQARLKRAAGDNADKNEIDQLVLSNTSQVDRRGFSGVTLAQLPDKPIAKDGEMPTAQWRDMLSDAPHLMIYGPSKAGKSTLAQAVVALLGDCEYVVIDPQPNKPNERKWGGVNFVTLDEEGDEYGSIKRALEHIEEVDKTRRQTQRTQVHSQLVVIIDEVLALVDGLGTVTNEEGKKEPRMSRFIRRMGYSARHRNIKIVLIGQGKNLKDLGLESGTARNNYALVRCARNAATNERNAYIVHDGGEQAMELRYVPELAARAASRARLWLSHEQMIVDGMDNDGSLLHELGLSVSEKNTNRPVSDGLIAPESHQTDIQTRSRLAVALIRRGVNRGDLRAIMHDMGYDGVDNNEYTLWRSEANEA